MRAMLHYRTAIALFCAMIFGSVATAQVRVFDGGGDGTAYNLDSNWDPNDVPDSAGESATIDGGGAWNVQSAGAVTIGNLTVGSDDMLTLLNASNFWVQSQVLNAGEIQITSIGTITDLLFNTGTTTLNGGGRLTLASSQARLIDESVSGTGALINVDNTIGGVGSIGVGTMDLTNQANGVITADVNGQTLILDPRAAAAFVNAGTYRAENNGILQLDAGAYDNTNGLIEALAGSTVALKNGAEITNGTLQTVGDGQITAAGTVELTDVTIDGDFRLLNAANVDLTGTINNVSNTITVTSIGTTTDLTVKSGTTTLTGGGTVALTSSATRILDEAVSGVGMLVNENNLIRGFGQFGVNSLDVVNQADGVITADVNGQTLVVDARTGGTFDNAGVMRAENGGTLELIAGEYDNTGGLILIKNSSTGLLQNSSAISNGTLRTEGNGQFTANGFVTLTDLTLDGSLVVNNAANLALVGTINNVSNTITVTSVGTTTDVRVDIGTTTLTGGGTVALQSNIARIVDEAVSGVGMLVNENNTIRGFGQLGANTLDFVNQADGVIAADVNGQTLVVDARTGGTFDNAGVMRAENGGTLEILAGEYDNTGGLILIKNSSTGLLQNSSAISNGTLRTEGNGQFTANGFVTLTDLTLDGSLVVNNAANLALVGTINNVSNTITVTSVGTTTDVRVDIGTTTLTGGGTVALQSNIARIVDEAVSGVGTLVNQDNTIRGFGQLGANTLDFVNQAGGSVVADTNGQTLIVDQRTGGVLTNLGTFAATGGGTLRVTDDFVNDGVIKAVGNASTVQFDNDLTNNLAGTLTGNSTIVADQTNNSGSISPGNSPGTLTLDTAAVTNGDSSVLRIEVGGLGEGTDTDLLVVLGDFQIDGTLEVIFLPGSESLQLTDTIRIVDALSLSAGNVGLMFDNGLITGGGSVGNYTVVVDEIAGDIILTGFSDIVPIPEPTALALLALGGLAAVRRRRG